MLSYYLYVVLSFYEQVDDLNTIQLGIITSFRNLYVIFNFVLFFLDEHAFSNIHYLVRNFYYTYFIAAKLEKISKTCSLSPYFSTLIAMQSIAQSAFFSQFPLSFRIK